MKKHNIRQLALEISKAQKKKNTPVKWKGKCRIILQEESDDEEDLLARAVEILEDVVKNKVSVEK